VTYSKIQDRGACSHTHPTNQEASSELALVDENPWGLDMFENIQIEEVNHLVSVA
jgi:hypothetical protein